VLEHPGIEYERAPRRGLGIGGGLVLLIFGAVGFWVISASLKSSASAKQPPGTPQAGVVAENVPSLTPLVLHQDLGYLEGTARALDNDAKDIANRAALVIVEAQEAQLEQQATIYAKQQAFEDLHQHMTLTVAAEHDAQSTRQAQATGDAVAAIEAAQAHVTQTGAVVQETLAAATGEALVSQIIVDRKRRDAVETWAGVEAIAWKVVQVVFVAALVGVSGSIGIGFALMLARKYQQAGQPQEIKPEYGDIPDNIRVEEKSNNGHTLKFDNLEIPPTITSAQLKKFFTKVFEGEKLAERIWAGYGKTFTDDQYTDLILAFENAGLVQNNHPSAPRQGRQITRKGWEVFGSIYRELHSPTPQPQFYAN